VIALNGGPGDTADRCAERRCTFLDAAASDGPRQVWILLLPGVGRTQYVTAPTCKRWPIQIAG
jgi:hypothetical protein